MRGDDDFRRGSWHEEDDSPDRADSPDSRGQSERTSPDLTPAPGRDNIQMFWESIGMKPGDDWKNEADDT